MGTMEIIITKMALCLLAALLIGLFFGYIFARRKAKEFFEHKIDALEELCEAKKSESNELKTKYGNMEIEMLRLKDINNDREAQISKQESDLEECRKKLETYQGDEEKISALEQMYAGKKEELENLKKSYDDLASDMETMKSMCDRYEKEILEYKETIHAFESTAEEQRQKEAELEKMQQEFAAKNAELEKLKKQYSDVDGEIVSLNAQCKKYEEEIESYKDSILYYQSATEECKKKEEEMLAQIDVFIKKNDALEQKLQNNLKEIAHETVDTEEIKDKLKEINTLLTEQGELVPQHIKNEIIQEVNEFHEEITQEIKGSKIAGFLEKIMKKIKK